MALNNETPKHFAKKTDDEIMNHLHTTQKLHIY
jgi:hypothetical protein